MLRGIIQGVSNSAYLTKPSKAYKWGHNYPDPAKAKRLYLIV